jgi:hypothetical protein
MCTAANRVSLVAPDNRGDAFFADASTPHHHDSTGFEDCASWRPFFHGDTVFTKSTWLSAIANFRFLQKYFPYASSPETAQRRFPKIFRQYFFAKAENNR